MNTKLPISRSASTRNTARTTMLQAARRESDRMLELARVRLSQRPGHLYAPTGTIALVMDCDTTGVEPDFAW